LLADIASIFAEASVDRLWSAVLCEKLAAIEERPWNEIHHGKAINANRLARMLMPYGVTSRKVRIGSETRQGYLRADFEDAWQSYVPGAASSASKWNNGTPPENTGDLGVSEVEQSSACSVPENVESAQKDKACSSVPFQKPAPELQELLV
jgi:hypothetical protein